MKYTEIRHEFVVSCCSRAIERQVVVFYLFQTSGGLAFSLARYLRHGNFTSRVTDDRKTFNNDNFTTKNSGVKVFLGSQRVKFSLSPASHLVHV